MKKIAALSGIILTAAIFSACKKKYDTPPLKTVNEGASITINQMKIRVPSSTPTASFYRFGSGDTSLYATVIGDEVSGNLYKTVFIQDDQNGAIQVNLTSAGGLRIGDKIRINLNNAFLVNVNSMIMLDSVDLGKSIVKLSSGNPVTPKEVTIAQILGGAVPSNTATSLQSQLIILKDAEFVEKNVPFADAVGKGSLDRAVKQCAVTGSVIARTSGYANFASKNTPAGNGTLIALVTQYNNKMQLTIRNYSEINMNNSGCPVLPPPTFTLAAPVATLSEDFNTVTANQVYTNPGWINYNETGSIVWKTDVTTSGTVTSKTLKATAFSSGDASNKMWIMAPPISYSSSVTKTLNFKTAFGFWDSGHQNAIMAYVSTDFNGSNFTTANWTPITTASYANGTGSFYPSGFTSSGTINLNSLSLLSGYNGTIFIAWKYTGTAGIHDSNIYLDDIVIQ